ncbi:hypothetical protein [Paenibacillus contaminans]|uniref:Uncharacterized protein n=1 Tax=Paenibacillus contaminans TaxID=450362 RepID=A0A329MLU2_9BACL|nr:hypothetical protein [Paenibacillus contaminans]RAV18857.1 hypothetical protein DQG23_24320 [Paenibacillus contaminans]
MKPQSYKVIKTDVGSGLFEGQTITPYFEDSNEIILPGLRADVHHHIRKGGAYITEHLEPIGGNNQ